MKLKWLFVFVASIGLAGGLAGASSPQEVRRTLDFLDSLDVQPMEWIPEETTFLDEGVDPVPIDMGPFYNDFEQDREVSFYVGYGYQAFYPERIEQISEMLKLLSEHYGVSLTDWTLSQDRRTLKFRDPNRGISYVVKVEATRDRYIEAFSSYDVVLYHGHSRWGQGPAFESFQNYFRMGRIFKTIEMDTFNRYFRDEEIQRTDKYPLLSVVSEGKEYPYQYRGYRKKKSKLPKDSYTKIIPGFDADLVKTKFANSRQIFFFYSCKNRKYFRDAIRDMHPDPSQKLVFGTFRNGHGATRPTAVMIMSVIRRAAHSSEVIRALNATKDCNDCFTSY